MVRDLDQAEILGLMFMLWWILDFGEAWAPATEEKPVRIRWTSQDNGVRLTVCLQCNWVYYDDSGPPRYVNSGSEYITFGSVRAQGHEEIG